MNGVPNYQDAKSILHAIELEQPCFKPGSLENDNDMVLAVAKALDSIIKPPGCSCSCDVCQMATHYS